jgi:hypothetical protein
MIKKIGPFLRNNFSGIYFFLVHVFNGVRKILSPYSIYITDSLGGSFKEYISRPEFNLKVTELKRNLDGESVRTIDVLIERMLKYPDERNRYKISKHNEIAGGLLSVERTTRRRK